MPGQNQALQRPRSEVATKEQKLELAMNLEQSKTKFSTICLGTLVFCFCLGVGVTLIIIGIVYTNRDSLILGGIFSFGGIVFSVIFITGQCRPYLKNRRINAEFTKEMYQSGDTIKPVRVNNDEVLTTTDSDANRVVTFY